MLLSLIFISHLVVKINELINITEGLTYVNIKNNLFQVMWEEKSKINLNMYT